MGLLSKLRKPTDSPPGTWHDASPDDAFPILSKSAPPLPPAVEATKQAIDSGDLAGAIGLMNSLSEAGNHLELSMASGVAVDSLNRVAFVTHVLANRSEILPEVSAVYMADAYIRTGWDARGSTVGKQVPPAAWKTLHESLRYAHAELRWGAKVAPDSPEVWTTMLPCGMGLGVSIEERMYYFERAHKIEPLYPPAVSATLQAIAGKWGGSNDLLFTFARFVQGEAPGGHPAHGAIAQSHVERVVAYNEPDWPYEMSKHDVVDELCLAFDKWTEEPIDMTLAGNRAAASAFFVCFEAGRKTRRLTACGALLGEHIDTYPFQLRKQCSEDQARFNYQVVRHRLGLLGTRPAKPMEHHGQEPKLPPHLEAMFNEATAPAVPDVQPAATEAAA